MVMVYNLPASFCTAQLNGNNGFKIDCTKNESWCNGVFGGDINDDGINDIIIGAHPLPLGPGKYI
ncbi:MAG: FG-GAP repeat protein [Candidatus Midichloria mitochondrii]